jgi:dipeptidyl aminopeptidase/acylaminoacyl peptidase
MQSAKLARQIFSWSLLSALIAYLPAVAATQSNSSSTSAVSSPSASAKSASGYDLPPKNILDVMHAPAPPVPYVSPTHDTILLVSWQEYPPMSRVATPFLRLAGVRVEPMNHSKHDTPGGYGITPCASNFELVRTADGAQKPIKLPAGACPDQPIWAADGKRFAFANVAPRAVELWIGEIGTRAVHKVPGVRLNPMFGNEIQWLPDQKTLLVKLIPDGIGPPPPEPAVPNGPSIQETDGEKGQSSTYENRDTLGSTHDEDLFDYYAVSQIAFVNAATSAIAPVGKPANFDSVEVAPDGKHVLIAAIHKPYSYVTTYDRFPREIEVWDTSNRARVAVHTIASLPLADRVPIRGVPLGPRDFSWRATDPATLLWAEALDGGDWNVKVPARDKILVLTRPPSR